MEKVGLNRGATSEDLARWGEIIASSANRVQMRSRSASPFRGTLRSRSMGPLRLLEVEASPHSLHREPGIGGPELIPILLQLQGNAAIRQDGRTVNLRSGHWTAWSAHRAHQVENETDVVQYVVLIPAGWCGLRAADLSRLCGRAYDQSKGVAGMVFHHVVQLFAKGDRINPAIHSDLADILAHLLRLAMEELRCGQEHVSLRETFRDRIADHIRHNIRNPNFSLDVLAHRFGCSKRHLHKVFNDGAITLNQFVWNERLEKCRIALEDPRLAELSVTEIAFSWGFNNSSHFNKLFRKRYGLPPGQWRANGGMSPGASTEQDALTGVAKH